MNREDWHTLVCILLKKLGGETIITSLDLTTIDLSGGFIISEAPDPFDGKIIKLITQEELKQLYKTKDISISYDKAKEED